MEWFSINRQHCCCCMAIRKESQLTRNQLKKRIAMVIIKQQPIQQNKTRDNLRRLSQAKNECEERENQIMACERKKTQINKYIAQNKTRREEKKSNYIRHTDKNARAHTQTHTANETQNSQAKTRQK